MRLVPNDLNPMRRIFRAGTIFSSCKRSTLLCAALIAVFAMTAAAQTPGFTMSNNGPIKLVSQQHGPVTVTVTPNNGFSGEVFLSCSNLPTYATCNFPNSNTSLGVNGAAASEAIVINTSAVNDYQSRLERQHGGMGRIALAAMFAPAAFLLLFARRRGMKLATTARLLLCVMALYPLAGLVGCAAVTPPSTPPGTYQFIISGALNTTGASTIVTLTVS